MKSPIKPPQFEIKSMNPYRSDLLIAKNSFSLNITLTSVKYIISLAVEFGETLNSFLMISVS
jgi:hypothetical protein